MHESVHAYVHASVSTIYIASLAEQPAVASTSSCDRNVGVGHKSEQKFSRSSQVRPETPIAGEGGGIGICQRSHLHSDRTHQMRKLPPQKILKVLDRIVECGTTGKLDQLGFRLPKSLGAWIRGKWIGKRSRFGLSSWMIGRIRPNICDRRSRLRPGTRRHQDRRSLRLWRRTGRLPHLLEPSSKLANPSRGGGSSPAGW